MLFGTDIVPNGTVIVQKGTVRGHKKGAKLRLVMPIFLAYFLQKFFELKNLGGGV